MEAYFVDVLNLLVRSLHIITGIAWIGASFYFVMLDNSLRAPEKPEDDVEAGRKLYRYMGRVKELGDEWPEATDEDGVFNNLTTGAPIHLLFENNNIRSKDYSNLIATPRPGHADYTANKKYKGYNDYRGGGHFSGRLTLCLVAAGAIAKKS